MCFAVWVAARPPFQGRDAALCHPVPGQKATRLGWVWVVGVWWACEVGRRDLVGRLERLMSVLFTDSSVQAAIGAKFCFLGMPHLQSSLWGSADFLPTCQAGLGSVPARCRLAGRAGRGVLAALHMAECSKTQAVTLGAAHPCAELHFPAGIPPVSIPTATAAAAGAPCAGSDSNCSHRRMQTDLVAM